MAFRASLVLAAVVALAGCSSQTSSTPKKPQATTVAVRVNSSPTAKAGKPVTHATTASRSTYDQARHLLGTRQYASAGVAFKKSISQGRRVADAYEGLGDADIGSRHYAAALSAYRHALALRPHDARLLYSTAYAALYTGKASSALGYANQYIHQRPRDANGYHLRFLVEGNLFRPKTQVADAQMVVRLRPTADGWNDLGIAQANSGQSSKATVSFTRAIAMQSNVGSYYMNRAIAENISKHPQAALADLQKARSLIRNPTQKAQIDRAIAILKKKSHR